MYIVSQGIVIKSNIHLHASSEWLFLETAPELDIISCITVDFV